MCEIKVNRINYLETEIYYDLKNRAGSKCKNL